MFLKRGVKKRIVYSQSDRKGGGVGPIGPDSNVKSLILFSLKFDSLTIKTHFFSLWRVPKMHYFMPFSWLSKWGAGLLQMIIRRAAAVRGGIGDSSSWMKIDFFFLRLVYGLFIVRLSLFMLSGRRIAHISPHRRYQQWCTLFKPMYFLA